MRLYIFPGLLLHHLQHKLKCHKWHKQGGEPTNPPQWPRMGLNLDQKSHGRFREVTVGASCEERKQAPLSGEEKVYRVADSDDFDEPLRTQLSAIQEGNRRRSSLEQMDSWRLGTLRGSSSSYT